MKRALCLIALSVLSGAIVGCMAGFGENAKYGITFYCPGVANMDLGDAGIRAGLERVGYRGQVARFTWSVSFNPLIDQTVRIIAEQGGKRLAAYIQEYIDSYPGREVNLVGLSAGSGVAIWALEALKPGYQVNNVVLIASSLHYKYDVRRALEQVQGKIYCYYSENDAVLAGPMKLFGTIDGVHFEDAAGAVGLHPPGGEDRIVNIPWKKEYERFGYAGGHGDATNPAFVEAYIAKHIVTPESAAPPQTEPAKRVATAPPGARQD